MSANDFQIIPQSSYKRMRWKNGAGWTTELALQNAEDGSWNWRISIAEIDADSDFSLFPGIDRTLLVLSGGGMILDVESGPSHTLRPLETPLVFPGESVIRSRLLDGPTRDFNVMTRRMLYSHTLELHHPGKPLHLERGPRRSCFVHVIDGTILDASLGDSLYWPEGAESSFELSSAATVLVVALHRQCLNNSS